MEFTYRENEIVLESPEGKTLARVTFPALDAETVEIDHTFVDDSLRGLRKLWALSGLHDLHVLKPLFHSGAEMGQEILRGDELLPKPL